MVSQFLKLSNDAGESSWASTRLIGIAAAIRALQHLRRRTRSRVSADEPSVVNMPTIFRLSWPDVYVAPRSTPANWRCAARPTIASFVPNCKSAAVDDLQLGPNRQRSPARCRAAARSPACRVDRLGKSTTTNSSADGDAAGRPSRAMPGACLMMSVSGPVSPLVISAVGAAAHDDRAIRAIPRPVIGGLEPFADRQHRDEHDDDAGDADDRDERRAEPLRNRPDARRA